MMEARRRSDEAKKKLQPVRGRGAWQETMVKARGQPQNTKRTEL
jgi:hypothetical protein